METTNIVLDRKKARELYRDYKKHAHWSSPIDDEIRRTYQLIAQGRIVIKALESIKAAGFNADGTPKLAIVRADSPVCSFRKGNGAAIFAANGVSFWGRASASQRISVRWPELPETKRYQYEAITPLVPIDMRPKRGLANYHILWEAEWEKKIPIDPMLLRRIGKGDLWLVVAAWDLTEIERAALAARLSS